MSIEALRTADERFNDLAGFPWAPHYIENLVGYSGLRMHYLDEGPREAPVFLCLHGEPSWSYLYRKMIPAFLAAGGRVVAPDFFGFGRSDKPVQDDVYTFDFHRASIVRLVEALDLRTVTLVVQDWGGIIGLTLPLEGADRYERLIVMNTVIATGEGEPPPGFVAWRDFMAGQKDLEVGRLMGRAEPSLSEQERAAYDAPFPDERYKAGVRRFPAIVPTNPEMQGADVGKRAAAFWKNEWSGPTFMAVGQNDPVLGPPVMELLRGMIRGCPEPMMVEDGGHFVQEKGDRIARAALDAFAG